MDTIHIQDEMQLQEKISHICSSGPGALHVVADFDRTLTKAFTQENKYSSTWGQLRHGGYLGEIFTRRSEELFERYYPIERSSTVSDQQKSAAMLEWWTKHLDLTVQHGLTQEMLYTIARSGEIHQREHLFEILRLLAQNYIPLLVFSAGLGDVIKEFFRYNDALTSNMHILANFYSFRDGKAAGFASRIVHSVNKNEIAIKETSYYTEILKRKNVILLGDSLGDLKMAEGLENECIIKIGFLNEQVQELMQAFSTSYDVVILNDGGMGYVKELIEKIVSQ